MGKGKTNKAGGASNTGSVRDAKGRCLPGHSLNPQGKPKGGKDVARSWLEAFKLLGGVDGLVEWAKDNRTEFYRGATKLFPKDMNITSESTITFEQRLAEMERLAGEADG